MAYNPQHLLPLQHGSHLANAAFGLSVVLACYIILVSVPVSCFSVSSSKPSHIQIK
ncbi:hypothetical protein LY78DRAFT_660526 [Colletotrichum sublineola]|nr:hypothetical protein LY78DRAFT_660526 [Colletotrichum sublineola]